MGTFNNNIDNYTTTNLEPSFSWQIGFNNFNAINSGVKFRATIRPLTNLEQYSRIPNSIVLYEETGISLTNTDNLGTWQFTFAKNSLTTGGPYRNYQVVIEAHDQQGNTSAGNSVATQGDNENGWTAYPNGYDIISINNPRVSGIELSNNLPTQNSATGAFLSLTNNSYASTQYMGSNGEIVVKFTSGTFQSGIVGGFIYTSATQFPKQDIFASTSSYGARVQKTRFDFDINNNFIYSSHAAFNVRGAPYCFASISFFDELDEVLLNNGIDISTGLYLSNNAIFYNDTAGGSLTLNGNMTIHSIQTTGYPAFGSSLITGLIGPNGIEVGRNSLSGTINLPGNITTIFYFSQPGTGLYTGIAQGQPGGIGGNASQNITGKQPGGFRSDTKVVVGLDSGNNPIYQSISTLKTGQTILSYIFPNLSGIGVGYNNVIDNWQNVTYNLTGLLTNSNSGSFTSGIITNIGSSIISGYIKLYANAPGISYDGNNFTSEQPIFLFTGLTSQTNVNYSGRFLQGSIIGTGFIYTNGSVSADFLLFQPRNPSISDFTPTFYGYPANNGLITNFPQQSKFVDATGLFYYIETKPYNVFFISGFSVITTQYPFLVHNSIYNY